MTDSRNIGKLKDISFIFLARHGLFGEFEIDEDTPVKHQNNISRYITNFHEEILPKLILILQAVIDDDRNKVAALLDKNPELLIIKPPLDLVVESKFTWQKFYAEEALAMATKRKQIEMVKIMLPYFDKLPQIKEVIEARNNALSAWKFYKLNKHAYTTTITIPCEYLDYIQSIMNILKEETFPNKELSEKAEFALSSLFNLLLPKKAVQLDDYIDVELFLLAAYKIYKKTVHESDNTINDRQKYIFCVRVIGLIQSVLSPETAKIFCEGLHRVIAEKKEISSRAASLMYTQTISKNGPYDYKYYRPSREPQNSYGSYGLGFTELCAYGYPYMAEIREENSPLANNDIKYLPNLCHAKLRDFLNIISDFKLQPENAQQQDHTSEDNQPSKCIMM